MLPVYLQASSICFLSFGLLDSFALREIFCIYLSSTGLALHRVGGCELTSPAEEIPNSFHKGFQHFGGSLDLGMIWVTRCSVEIWISVKSFRSGCLCPSLHFSTECGCSLHRHLLLKHFLWKRQITMRPSCLDASTWSRDQLGYLCASLKDR
uniref:Uncharacterized protein n=1 Tax=Cacopsylla melanoneura TaxID=428564 RepID=A0A8D8W567_9HEMI